MRSARWLSERVIPWRGFRLAPLSTRKGDHTGKNERPKNYSKTSKGRSMLVPSSLASFSFKKVYKLQQHSLQRFLMAIHVDSTRSKAGGPQPQKHPRRPNPYCWHAPKYDLEFT